MKYWLFLAALLLTEPSRAATPLDTRQPRVQISVDYFLEACTVVGETAHGMVPHFDCESFLYGVVDTLAAMTPVAGEAATCVPPELAPWGVYQLLLESEAGDREELAARWVMRVLRAEFPCAENQAAVSSSSVND